MALLKLNKTISALVKDTTNQVVDKFAAFLDTKIDMDDDMKALFDEFKTICHDDLKATPVAKKGRKTKAADDIKPKSKKAKAAKSDTESEGKKKRAPTAYNLFLKQKMAELKEQNPKSTPKERMAEAVKLWKAQKEGVVEEFTDMAAIPSDSE